MGGQNIKWLYDTGATVSVISDQLYRSLQDKGVPVLNRGTLTSANSSKMKVVDRRTFQFSRNNSEATLPVYVVENLNERAIAGMDLINALGICYDPRVQDFISEISVNSTTAMANSEFKLKPFEAMPVKLRLQEWDESTMALVNINAPEIPGLFASPCAATVYEDNKVNCIIKNCSGVQITIPRGYPLGSAEPVQSIQAVDEKKLFEESTGLPEPLPEDRRKRFLNSLNLNVPSDEKQKYIQLLLANHDVFSRNPEDLGTATHFEHAIQLKNFDPIFRKQFRIPDQHRQALETQVEEWLKMGIIEPCHSRYNSSIFVVPKKGGKLRFVLDYRGLNDASHDDRYCMKDVNECIGDIGRAESTIFSTMDLTSGFWQLPLQDQSKPYTAFTVPGMGQYQYKVLSMGLKGGPGSFQRMMELTTKGLNKIIVYIDDLLLHSKTHDEHRADLVRLFVRLRHFNLKLNLEKCFFGATNVAYLGYRLTPQGILPGVDKLKCIRDAVPPTSVSQVRAFLGLCNFFRSHVSHFATLAAPLIKLTTKEAAWKGPVMPPEALQSFKALQDALVCEPVVQYPRNSRKYELYTDASTGGSEFKGGYGAVLTQRDEKGESHVIAYASRALQKHEENYTPFLAEMMAAVWAMQHFSVYLKGRKFTLFTDHKPLEKLGKVHTKTLNRLQEMMTEFDFELCYKPGKEMPADYLSRMDAELICSLDFHTADLREAQSHDLFCIEIRNFIRNHEVPTDNARATLIKRLAPLVEEKAGVLFRTHTDPVTDQTTSLLILPRALIPEAVHRAHGTLLTGHGGIEKTKRRLLACYYWPNMQADIKEALIACPRCQVTKPPKAPKKPLHPLPQCSAPNQRLHMDLFGPLKTPTRAKAYILCMTDAFTKYVEVALVPDKSAETVSQIIFDHWICRYGLPIEVVTDGGKEFCNKVAQDLYDKLRISHSHTSPSHPQCNAQAEVANKHFQKYLARMCENETLHWEHLLPPMALAYNTSVHRTTGVTPSFLMFGFQPLLPGLIPPSLEESDNNVRLQALQRARDGAHEESTKMAQSYKLAHDKNATQVDIRPGQQVLLDVRLFPNCNQKIADKFEGPYFVVKVYPKGVVDILRNSKVHRVNMDRLKIFIPQQVQEYQLPQVDPEPANPSSNPAAFEQEDNHIEKPVVSDSQDKADITKQHDEDKIVPQQQVQEKLVPGKRGPGRPRKTITTTKSELVPTDNTGPVTRSKGKLLEKVQSIETPSSSSMNNSHNFQVSKFFKLLLNDVKLREEVETLLFNKLINKFPELGKCRKRTAPLKPGKPVKKDEFGIPFRNASHPAYLARKSLFQSLPQELRNRILTGDPWFTIDPTAYEYCYLNPAAPAVQTHMSHLFPQNHRYENAPFPSSSESDESMPMAPPLPPRNPRTVQKEVPKVQDVRLQLEKVLDWTTPIKKVIPPPKNAPGSVNPRSAFSVGDEVPNPDPDDMKRFYPLAFGYIPKSLHFLGETMPPHIPRRTLPPREYNRQLPPMVDMRLRPDWSQPREIPPVFQQVPYPMPNIGADLGVQWEPTEIVEPPPQFKRSDSEETVSLAAHPELIPDPDFQPWAVRAHPVTSSDEESRHSEQSVQDMDIAVHPWHPRSPPRSPTETHPKTLYPCFDLQCTNPNRYFSLPGPTGSERPTSSK